jgi:hypothetical protein
MKTNTPPAVVATVPTPATVVPGGFTLGLDLGDRRHHVCVLDGAGQIVGEGALANTRPALAIVLAELP